MSLCTQCGEDSKVLETRFDARGWRIRRRSCKSCEARYWTYEVPAETLTIEEPDTPDDEPGGA